jgi:hypothetical protein
VSHVHYVIALCADMCFYLNVVGRDFMVGGELFYRGECVLLKNETIIAIAGIPLLFLENPEHRVE